MTSECPFCGYLIPIALKQGHVWRHEIEIKVDFTAVEIHYRYCAKNPEATPL